MTDVVVKTPNAQNDVTTVPKDAVVKKKSLPYQICNVTQDNIMQLRTINIKTLPVRYSDTFYRELNSKYDQDYLKLVFWGGFAVAACCARVEPQENEVDNKIYIMTINVLPTYRRRGIASELLKYILETAAKDKTIKEAYLHVQTSNLDAKEFYLSKGFEEECIVENYYKGIEPTSGFLLKKMMPEA